MVDTPAEAIAAQPVLLGSTAETALELRAQPGVEMPLAGEVSAGQVTEQVGAGFDTNDGQIWWQLRADEVLGWTAERVAYRGPAEQITDSVRVNLADTTYPSAEAATQAVLDVVASTKPVDALVTVSMTEIEAQGSATVTTDLIGTDGAIVGWRIVVASSLVDDQWQPSSVTQFPLCNSGVASDGTCL